MRVTQTSDLWWKSAIIYCLDIETYLDTNGDGVGDLGGLARRIDYLAELGVNCLWLMPFYPSPDRDDGYDVMDFYGVDQRLGNHGEFVEVVRTAHDRGIRVIIDLIVNHTSDQHPWFKESRKSRDNPYRDFYVWRATEPPDTSEQVVFPDQEDSIWTKDDRTGEWYLHHFYSHQPDLNVANPAVRDEILRTIGFWLELGVDGFRVDAVPFFTHDIETESGDTVPANPHELLKEVRSFLGRRKGGAMLLGEVNLPHDQQYEYFGKDAGDELTMMFDFIGMQATYLSLARGEAAPLVNALLARPEVHPTCQWANFLRNHDELTLDKLTDEERQEVFDAFGPDPAMQVFGRGLKRRLPTMLGGDPRRIRMAYSLMFSLPGTPTIYYGEEIGMGEDLEAEGRMAVRTPMQWSAGPNGGFSTAPSRKLIQRPVPDGYGPPHVNAADQRHDRDSLWTFMRTLIGARRRCAELGWGEFSVIEQPNPAVLAHRCDLDGSSVIAVHNFAAEPAVVTLELDGDPEAELEISDLLERDGLTPAEGRLELALEGYGYKWLRVRREGELAVP
ncbi:alpha-amylase family protein [Ruicaihuangia caeni]|uniref:Alpha-amylase family protein n=1 Tax=Ruicaihuangia caeni TaxID=3042517 RepID=A0AAW6T708_9MICO|nr:alpha-amylase family protein [Klugiella sp. YN-L-19]MDI2099605.1 alpha-amylase family protein [Klugiella sp. YN-L-19]